MEHELEHGGRFAFWESWLPRDEADALFEKLGREVPWREQAITLFGKRILQPRLTAWYGDPSAIYTYSGLTLTPLPWMPALLDLRAHVESAAGGVFNSVLLNHYRDGQDSMGMHADDEPELGVNPVIASVSLGATRRFLLRPRKGTGAPISLALSHGSLLVMADTTQHHYRHGLPKQAGATARINLTFRRIFSSTERAVVADAK